MENVTEALGKIRVSSSKIVTSDPCYTMDAWCADVINTALNGNYNAYIEISDEGAWGKRVKRLFIVHEDYDNKYYVREYESNCGVDSGTFCFADHDYYAERHTEKLDEDWYYKNVCNRCEENGYVVDGVCAISSSGYGDGGYNVYSYREKNGYAVGAEIIFIDDYDEEDEWDGEYDDDEYFAFREEWDD